MSINCTFKNKITLSKLKLKMPNHTKIKVFIWARGSSIFISRGSSECPHRHCCHVTVMPILQRTALTLMWWTASKCTTNKLAQTNCGNASPCHQTFHLQVTVPPLQIILCTSPQDWSGHRLMPIYVKNSKRDARHIHMHTAFRHVTVTVQYLAQIQQQAAMYWTAQVNTTQLHTAGAG
jgi:hypothetical protein